MHASSQGLKRETKVLVARSEASQRKAACDLTPFLTKKALADFLARGPTWLNDFIPHVRVKLQRFESDHESRLRYLHTHIAHLNKTARCSRCRQHTPASSARSPPTRTTSPAHDDYLTVRLPPASGLQASPVWTGSLPQPEGVLTS